MSDSRIESKRSAGVEPALPAWQAGGLPLSHDRETKSEPGPPPRGGRRREGESNPQGSSPTAFQAVAVAHRLVPPKVKPAGVEPAFSGSRNRRDSASPRPAKALLQALGRNRTGVAALRRRRPAPGRPMRPEEQFRRQPAPPPKHRAGVEPALPPYHGGVLPLDHRCGMGPEGFEPSPARLRVGCATDNTWNPSFVSIVRGGVGPPPAPYQGAALPLDHRTQKEQVR